MAVSIGLYSFAEKVDIAPGGVSGIALMIRYLSGVPVGVLILLINIPLILVADKFMGRKFAVKTMRTVIINSIVLDGIVTPFFPQYGGDRMLGSLFAGVFVGAGLSLVFISGSSTGGTDIVGHLVERRFPHISIGKALMMVDCIILAISAIVFENIESALYGIVALFTQTVVINRLVYGAEKGRNLFVISQKNDRIAERILKESDRGATFLSGYGAYSKSPVTILMCVVRIWEYHHVKEIVYNEDPEAFVIATQAENIIGEGFTRSIKNNKRKPFI